MRRRQRHIPLNTIGRLPASIRLSCLAVLGILILVETTAPVLAQSILATPGFTWGQLRAPSSRQEEEKNNEIVEGAINQGIDWLEVTKGVRLNSFVQLDFTRDTKKFDYNNKLKFAVGTQLNIALWDWGSLAIGGKYEWDRRYVSDRTPKGAVGFLNWYAARSWVPKIRVGTSRPLVLAYSVSTWGQFSYPSSQEVEEKRNAIVEGAIEGAADFWKKGERLVASGFASLDYKADTDEFDFNNKLEPALGARLRLHATQNAFVDLGAKLVNEYRFKTHRSEAGAIVFLNWAASW